MAGPPSGLCEDAPRPLVFRVLIVLVLRIRTVHCLLLAFPTLSSSASTRRAADKCEPELWLPHTLLTDTSQACRLVRHDQCQLDTSWPPRSGLV